VSLSHQTRIMSLKIVPTSEYITFLEKKYEALKVPTYKLREWFSIEQKVFFDCKVSDKASCLSGILNKPDLPAFIIYLMVKDAAGGYSFMDVSFRNLGKETLEHFINRYHQQFETMTKLSLQSVSREFIECLGHCYEERMP
jgi:hypothetical protein